MIFGLVTPLLFGSLGVLVGSVLGHFLGDTFPFNLIIGIPVYYEIAAIGYNSMMIRNAKMRATSLICCLC